jgi:hypothetical protein
MSIVGVLYEADRKPGLLVEAGCWVYARGGEGGTAQPNLDTNCAPV